MLDLFKWDHNATIMYTLSLCADQQNSLDSTALYIRLSVCLSLSLSQITLSLSLILDSRGSRGAIPPHGVSLAHRNDSQGRELEPRWA